MPPSGLLLTPFHAARELLCRLRRPAPGAAPAWTRRMTGAALLLPVLLLVLHPWDAQIVRAAASSDLLVMEVLRAVTDLGRRLYWWPLAGLVWIATSGAATATPVRLHGWATLMLGALAVASIPVEIGKRVVGRARPALLDQAGPDSFTPFQGGFLHQSFPSGHAMMAGVLFVSLWIFLPRWRLLTAFACLALAYSRLAAGAHFPTDVVAGFAIGALAACWTARFLAARAIIFVVEPGRTLPRA